MFYSIVLGSTLSGNLGIEHPLIRIAYMPPPVYSNMAGYSFDSSAFHYYAIYWASFGVIISILSFKIWNRKEPNTGRIFENFNLRKWNKSQTIVMILASITFVLAGLSIYDELNIQNTYYTPKTELTMRKSMKGSQAIRIHSKTSLCRDENNC